MDLWNRCTGYLEGELPSQDFNTWIRPLQTVETDGTLQLLAPNSVVLNLVNERYLDTIQ